MKEDYLQYKNIRYKIYRQKNYEFIQKPVVYL